MFPHCHFEDRQYRCGQLAVLLLCIETFWIGNDDFGFVILTSQHNLGTNILFATEGKGHRLFSGPR